MRITSIENLLKLPNMTREGAIALRESNSPLQAMNMANEIMQGHGVETVMGFGIYVRGKAYNCYLDAHRPVLSYVNMGDTYALTLCYNEVTGYLFVETWGGFVERNTKRYKIA
jgi:hypothetical protein